VTAEQILAQAHANGVEVALTAPGDGLELLSVGDPPADLVALLTDAKTEIISRLHMERRMINHWVAAHLIEWPREHCLGCRKPVVTGQEWIDVTNGEARARFHQECHRVWVADQEALARKTIGLSRPSTCNPTEERKRHGWGETALGRNNCQ
jgi:hypothetical protein